MAFFLRENLGPPWRYLLPLVLAAGLVFTIVVQVPLSRSDRLVLLALLAAGYGAAFLAIHAGVALGRRIVGQARGDGFLETFLFLGAFLVNHLLTLFGHKSLGALPRLEWWMALHPAAEAGLVLLALAGFWFLGRPVFNLVSRCVPGRSAKAGLLLAALSLPLLPAVRPAAQPPPSRPAARPVLAPLARGPLVLVGIDGIDERLLRAAARAISLPNFSSLLDDGQVGSLDNGGLGLSPVVWTTLITGREPHDHGLIDFRVSVSGLLDEPLDRWVGAVPPSFGVKSIVFRGLAALGQLGQRKLSGRDRRGLSVFQVLSHHGRRSLVVNYMMSFPAEKIEGDFLAEYVYSARLQAGPEARNMPPGAVHPRGLISGKLAQIAAVPAERGDLFLHDRRDFEYSSALALALLEERSYDLVVYYTPWTDLFNHRLTVREYDQMLAGQFEAGLPRRFLETYATVDAFLGALRARLPGADLLVVSDHGAGPMFRIRKPVSGAQMTFHEPPGEVPGHLAVAPILQHLHSGRGFFAAQGPSFPRGTRGPVSMYDIAPTILAYLGVPVPRDLPGKVLADLVPEASQERVDSYEGRVLDERIDADAHLVSDADERLRALGYIQ